MKPPRRITIPTAAINRFLKQKRDDFRPWKSLSEDELQDMCDDLPVTPPIWHKLRFHQKVSFLIGATVKRFLYILDTGSGKTLLAIALIRYLCKSDQLWRAMVLVPYNVNKVEWKDEILKHSPKTSFVVLTGSSEKKWQLLEEADDLIVICTYMGLARMVCDLKPRKKGKGMRLVPNQSRMKRLLKSIDGLVLDESSFVGTRSRTVIFRVLRKLSQTVKLLVELSGTPFGREPTPLWPQMFLIDHGESLGPNMGIFRAALYKTRDNYFTGMPTYVFDKSKSDVLHRLLAHRSIRYEADKADLPDLVHIPKYVSLGKDVEQYADQAREQIKRAYGNYQEMQNAFIRMRQISSGFLGYTDDETGAKAKFEFTPNPKLELLLSVIASIPDEYKTLIFHDFIYSGEMITRELKKLKLDHVWVHGGTKDSDKALTRFKKDPDCRFMVMNTAGQFGLNLQVARYGIFYESPVPVIARKQMIRRFERQYSEHDTVFLYDLVTHGTYDQQILDAHKEGADLFQMVVNGKVKLR